MLTTPLHKKHMLRITQEVRWDKEGTIKAGDYSFFYVKGNENDHFGTGFFVHHRIVSAVKRVEFVSDRGGVIYSSERAMVQYHSSKCACTK